MATEGKISEDLELEMEAVNSIYGPKTLLCTNRGKGMFLLSPPDSQIGLKVHFPEQYPAEPPKIEGSETLGKATPRGYATEVLKAARIALDDVYELGNVCVYNLIETLQPSLAARNTSLSPSLDRSIPGDTGQPTLDMEASSLASDLDLQWTMSEAIIQNKSTFVGFATRLTSSALVTRAIESLLANNRKIAKATHNISAYRISQTESSFDDDGENGAGSGVANLLESMDMVNCLVVVSRWFGGIKLGSDRFRLINRAAREALIKLRDQKQKHTSD